MQKISIRENKNTKREIQGQKSISVISWWSVLLVEEAGVPRENHRPVASHWQTLSHNVVSRQGQKSGSMMLCDTMTWLILWPPPPKKTQKQKQNSCIQHKWYGDGLMTLWLPQRQIGDINNISVISWWSVLLVEEAGVPRENHRPVASHWQTSSHNVVSPEWDSNSH
jgi:hypothetical protein